MPRFLHDYTVSEHACDVCRHPYKRVLTLTNSSKLPCKCEVMAQEARSQGLATFTTSPISGVIPAKGDFDVEVTLQASRLGRIQLPLQFKVCLRHSLPVEPSQLYKGLVDVR